MHIRYKKLPKGWKYAITPRHAKQLVAETAADIRIIEYCGTRRPHPVADELVLWLGELNARVHVDHWCYRLRLWGAPEDLIKKDTHQIREAILTNLKTTILSHLHDRVDETIRPLDSSLRFRIRSGQIIPDIETKLRDTREYLFDQLHPWWLDTTAS